MKKHNRKKLLSKIDKFAQESKEQSAISEPSKPIDPALADQMAHDMFIKIVESIDYNKLLDEISKDLN